MTTILIIALVVGLLMAIAIGANDVANSMATAVGAKAITIKQAVIIAAILEFAGAYVFGKGVTETIRKGIVDVSFINNPNMLIYGALAALISAMLWIFLSTIFSLPVSTTHSIVGGMVGFGIMAAGLNAIQWAKILFITIGWIVSPFVGGALAYIMFRYIAGAILHHRNSPAEQVRKIGPILIGLTFFVIGVMFFVKVLHIKQYLLASLISLGIGLSGWLIGKMFVRIFVKNKKGIFGEYDLVEEIFRRMQIFTSCYVALAHGSNDVANAIGPLAAIYVVAKTGIVSGKVMFPRWLLALGGLGIALGVALWGYRVMRTVGTKITELTNTRGFSIDFATATTVLFASILGFPVSSTHTVVGSVVGVGYARGLEAVNLSVLKNIIISWALTVPVAALTAAGIYKLLIVMFL